MSLVAVVPLLYSGCVDDDSQPRLRLKGRPLWEITLEQALAATGIDRVVAAHDHDHWPDLLASWGDRIELVRRPAELSLPSATTLDVLAFVARSLRPEDKVMLLEITHPLRPKGVLNQIATAAKTLDADSLVTCHPVRYSFWRQVDGSVPQRLAGTGEDGEVKMYEELIGIGSVFSPRFLGTDNPFGNQVDVIPIDRFWATVDVRDTDGLWLAERTLERIET